MLDERFASAPVASEALSPSGAPLGRSSPWQQQRCEGPAVRHGLELESTTVEANGGTGDA